MAFRSSQNITCHGYSYNVRAVFKRLQILVYRCISSKPLKIIKTVTQPSTPSPLKKRDHVWYYIIVYYFDIMGYFCHRPSAWKRDKCLPTHRLNLFNRESDSAPHSDGFIPIVEINCSIYFKKKKKPSKWAFRIISILIRM